jgi:hypothetical protein
MGATRQTGAPCIPAGPGRINFAAVAVDISLAEITSTHALDAKPEAAVIILI